eukprot:scpid55066/ scgid19980/ Uncharacterized protein F58A4.6
MDLRSAEWSVCVAVRPLRGNHLTICSQRDQLIAIDICMDRLYAAPLLFRLRCKESANALACKLHEIARGSCHRDAPSALLPLSNGQTAALSIGKLEIAATRRDEARRRDYHHGNVEHCDDSAVRCVYHEAVCHGNGNGVRNTCHTLSSSCAEGTSPSSHSAEENGVCRSTPSLGDSPCQRHSNAQPITDRRHTSSHRNHENGYDDVIGPCGDDGDVSADCNGERGSCRRISLCDGVGTCTGTCQCSGDAMTRRDHCEQCHNATDAVQNGELPRHSRAVQFNHITPTNQHQTGDSHHAAASSPCARTRCTQREGQTCPSTSLTRNHSRAQQLAMPMAKAYLRDCGETCVDRAKNPAAWRCTRSLIIETATKHAAESGSDTGMLVLCVSSLSPVVFVGTSDWRWYRRLLLLVLRKAQVDSLLAWFSTLGGAHSALGDCLPEHAHHAESVSLTQLRLSLKIGDAGLISRCYLFLALSYLQQSRLRQAKLIIRSQRAWIRSSRFLREDSKLFALFTATRNKLRSLVQQQQQQRK